METKQTIQDFINNAIWYHTIKFPNDLTSNGVYDHKNKLKYYGFPDNLDNKSVLDVGASDGFFSFEFEKRKAKEVVAIDTHNYDGSIGHTDISPAKIESYQKKYSRHLKEKELFSDICKILNIENLNRLLVAKSLLNSSVKFKEESIYNLKSWNDKFDLVFCGDLIEHLKDPLGALENLASVTNNTCIIALSSSIKQPIGPINMLPYRIAQALNIVLKKIGIRLIQKEESSLLEYHGNKAGGSFFHFYPETFKNLALASGFKKVRIFSEFNLENKKKHSQNYHFIFHCYV